MEGNFALECMASVLLEGIVFVLGVQSIELRKPALHCENI